MEHIRRRTNTHTKFNKQNENLNIYIRMKDVLARVLITEFVMSKVYTVNNESIEGLKDLYFEGLMTLI